MPREMSSSEYHAMYYWGEYPERFWPREEADLKSKYARGEISQAELEDSLDDMMGISRLQGYNGTFHKSTASTERGEL